MSDFSRRSPAESDAAWQQQQQQRQNVALRHGHHGPHDDDHEQRAKREQGTRELHRLLTQLQESPTPEHLERFCRVSEEVTRLAEQSFLRTMERDRYQDMCIAGLQEGIENYRHMFDEHLRLVDFVHQQHVLALHKQIELEKRKRVYAENELRKATSAHEGL